MFRMPVRVIGVAAFLISPVASAQAPLAPSGGDDTAALTTALQSCVPGGPGCTVQLGLGTFRTTQILISDFHGTLVGAGTGKTTIEPYGQLHVDKDSGPSGIYSAPPSATHPYPFLITFLTSDVTVSGLTLSVPNPEPTDGWYYGCDNYPDCSANYVTWLKTMISVDGSARYYGVEFAGAPGIGGGVSVNNGPDINGSGWGAGSGGEFIVQNSRFALLDNGFEVGPVDGLRATIGGSPGSGNVFTQSVGGIFFVTSRTTIDYSYNDIAGAGLVSFYNDGNRINFSHNRVNVLASWIGGAVDVENYRGVPRPAASTVVVEHNDITVTGPGTIAMYLDDRWRMSGLTSMDVVIADNAITVTDPDAAQANSGIWLRFLADALVQGNRISGAGCTALYLGRIAFSTIIANNLQGFVANDQNCGLPAAVPMIFYADGLGYAHDNVVVGGGAKLSTTVYDMGLLEGLTTNNILVGVNSMQGNPPGPAVSQAMQNRRILR